jgi:hypothetical protein
MKIRHLATTLLLFPLVGCSTFIESIGGVAPNSPAPSPSFTYNSLSGRLGQDGRVLAVKIDDTEQARPQIGLRDADVIYIEQVEGGVTRLAAIYSSRYPAKIGPVRSARISDMELLAQYGRVAFAFSGAQSNLRPIIESANLFNIGADHEGVLVYSRDKSRRAPWNMILNTQALFERIDERELEVVVAKNMGWTFKKKTKLGKEIVSAKMRWPTSRYEISWSDEYAGWVITHNGTSKIDAGGVPVVASTFIAQLVSITVLDFGDKFGGRTPFVATVGAGDAFIFRDGRVITGRWSRPDKSSGTTFSTAEGEEIAFKAGQIWFALVEQEPEITYRAAPESAQSASPMPTK